VGNFTFAYKFWLLGNQVVCSSLMKG